MHKVKCTGKLPMLICKSSQLPYSPVAVGANQSFRNVGKVESTLIKHKVHSGFQDRKPEAGTNSRRIS